MCLYVREQLILTIVIMRILFFKYYILTRQYYLLVCYTIAMNDYIGITELL